MKQVREQNSYPTNARRAGAVTSMCNTSVPSQG